MILRGNTIASDAREYFGASAKPFETVQSQINVLTAQLFSMKTQGSGSKDQSYVQRPESKVPSIEYLDEKGAKADDEKRQYDE